MKVEVIEISGYRAAFQALYITNRNLTLNRNTTKSYTRIV